VIVPKNAMFIDDDEIDQLFYRRNIVQAGMIDKSFHFFKAEEALDFVNSGNCPEIDVVVLDVRMPGMDGFEFLKRLAESSQRHAIRAVAVMMTVPLSEHDKAQMGASDLAPTFLNKPLDIEKLREVAISAE